MTSWSGIRLAGLDLEKERVEILTGSKAKIDDLGPGLGECFLTKSSLSPELGYKYYPSKRGHLDFSPRGMMDHLRAKFGDAHCVLVESVVSGTGLANMYNFLTAKFPKRAKRAIHEELMCTGDQ